MLTRCIYLEKIMTKFLSIPSLHSGLYQYIPFLMAIRRLLSHVNFEHLSLSLHGRVFWRPHSYQKMCSSATSKMLKSNYIGISCRSFMQKGAISQCSPHNYVYSKNIKRTKLICSTNHMIRQEIGTKTLIHHGK